MTTTLAVVAATWGVVMALSPVLQIRRMVVRRSSDDVSIAYFLVVCLGFCLWIAYGVSLGNLALVIPNSVAVLVAVATIAIAARYRGRSTVGTGSARRQP